MKSYWKLVAKPKRPDHNNRVLIYTKKRRVYIATYLTPDVDTEHWLDDSGRYWTNDELAYWAFLPDAPHDES
jgi:hypothetical protein